MVKRSVKIVRGNVIPSISMNVFWSKFLRVLGDISLVLSAIFIFLGLGEEGFAIFSSGSFWTVINSFWLFSFILFYYSDRLSR